MKTAVLIPCYNESMTIEKVVRDYRAALPDADIYVYDNNSKDGTDAIARRVGAIVRYERRQGKGNVIRTMFREIDADCYLMIDGDDTYPAEHAAEMVRMVLEDKVDMVVGDRLSSTYFTENKRPFHNAGNVVVRKLVNLFFKGNVTDIMTGYRAFTRAFVKTMPVMSGGFQIETEISIWAVDRRWRVADVPIDYRDRPEGSESKLSTFSDGMLVLAAIASLFRDYRPMAFFGWLGLALAVVGLCFGLPVVAEYFDTGYVAKLPSAVLAVALMIVAALSWTAGLILDTVAKSHRRQWEMSVYRVMEADAER